MAKQIPQWIKSQRKAGQLCECCGRRPYATVWAGTGESICWECCTARQSLAMER